MSGHGAHADASDPFQKRAAVAIAIFTVILAFANMLTNQARTRAILSSNRATNQWAYYQSKSTKQLLTQMRRDLMAKLPNATTAEELATLDGEAVRYDKEKDEIKRNAEALALQEAEAEHQEHFYEYAATVAELAIVLAGIALLMSGRKLLGVAVAIAACALCLVAFTAFALKHPAHAEEHEPADPGAHHAG